MVTTTNYIYDGFQLLGETDETGTITRRYINEPDDYTHPIGHTDIATGESSYYHYDGQGNTREVTDENENVTDTFTFDSWGTLLARTGMTNVPFQFGGEHGYYKDEELDTYYVMERIYDPSIIRWLSVDPIGFSGNEINLYQFVINSPLMFIDSSGLAPQYCCRRVQRRDAPPLTKNGCTGSPDQWCYKKNERWSRRKVCVKITSCCDEHDLCYQDCSSLWTKEECDDSFHRCLEKKCRSHLSGGQSYANCLRRARWYYRFVSWFGGSFYRAAQCKQCECDNGRPLPGCTPGKIYIFPR